MRNTRTFDAYSNDGAATTTARQQAEQLAYNEIGQNWHFRLTLRVPRQDSDRLLLQALEDYFALLEQELRKNARRRRERILRSIYIHKGNNDYHAHVYSKYPKKMVDWQKRAWDEQLLQCWYKTPVLRGHIPTNDIDRNFLYHHRPRIALHKEWGVYGIKNNSGAQAWIDDLSVLHHSINKAAKKGKRFCRSIDK